jgi:uncharacterized protein YecE (DUF72 family)
VAYTVVDEPLLPPEVHVTADFAYFRWHGKGEDIWFDYRYSQEELEPWVGKVQETTKEVKMVYGYFNAGLLLGLSAGGRQGIRMVELYQFENTRSLRSRLHLPMVAPSAQSRQPGGPIDGI